MPGWDSVSTAATMQSAFAVTGLVLLVVLAALAAVAAWQLRSRQWPEWLDVGVYQVHSRIVEIGAALVLALLLVVEVIAYGYAGRERSLMAAVEQANVERVAQLTAEVKSRPPAAHVNRYVKENSALLQRLNEAEGKVAALEKSQADKRLSAEKRRYLIEALRPFAGQKVSIASIRGDNEGLALAQDFVAVFDAAGWDHHGDAGVTTQDWPRDPVGIEIALNEDDARHDHISAGVAALINTVRKLGLVYDNTVYMDSDVPEGQALLKVGKKLRQ